MLCDVMVTKGAQAAAGRPSSVRGSAGRMERLALAKASSIESRWGE